MKAELNTTSCPSIEEIEKVCEQVIEELKKEKSLLRLQGCSYIFGDIHGNQGSKEKILLIVKKALDEGHNVLFLGDYIDRGEDGILVVFDLFKLKMQYPNKVFLLRGNHEDREISSYYGFSRECEKKYSSNGAHVFELINSVFDNLPLVAVLNNFYLCVHGGISPELKTLNQIEKLPKPFKNLEELGRYEDFVTDLLWSDPNKFVNGFLKSDRGAGHVFGQKVLDEALANLGRLKGLIRAHQVKNFETRKSLDNCFTIFSSDNYPGGKDNIGFAMIVDENTRRYITFDTVIYSQERGVSFNTLMSVEF